MIAPVYTILYIQMKKIAEKCGYALALHGSMNRDLDLVAIPWIEEAETLEYLLGKFRKDYDVRINAEKADTNIDKPHGRKAYTLMLKGGYYIDLSIMPLKLDGDL